MGSLKSPWWKHITGSGVFLALALGILSTPNVAHAWGYTWHPGQPFLNAAGWHASNRLNWVDYRLNNGLYANCYQQQRLQNRQVYLQNRVNYLNGLP